MTTWLMAALLALVGAGIQQGAGVQLRIVEPTSDTLAMGPSVMRIAIEPASEPVQQVTFFADGRVACRVPQPPFECAWNAGNELREHQIKVNALLKGGRKVAADVTTKGADINLKETVARIMVTVSVLDGDRFVRGLDHTKFRVYDDNVLQKTDFCEPQKSSLEVAVGVDISESMTDAIEGVKQNVIRFLSALRPDDKATIGAFNEKYYVAAPSNIDRAAQLRKVDLLAAWGMTSLYEVVLRSFDQLSALTGRHALVIFSDGEDTSSRISEQAVEKRVERNDAVLYIIGQGKVLQSADLKALCGRLADKSGGTAFFPRDAAALAAAFDRITEELANQYFLTFEPRSPKGDGRYHRLRVEVAGYKVRAPQGYTR